MHFNDFFIYLDGFKIQNMNGNSHSIEESMAFSHFIFNKIFSFKIENENNASESSIQTKRNSHSENIGGSYFLSNFWNKLVAYPESFNQTPNIDISTLLEEEKGISSSKLVSSVLSQKLTLANNSTELLIAVEKCHKIFHEDFPGDFILEYNGNRLGLFLMDICYDSQGKANVEYKYKPEIKSFKGLF